MSAACSPPQPEPTHFAAWNPARGVWETHPINPACGHWACYSGTWPTSGTTRAGRAYALPMSARRTAATERSSPRGPQSLEDKPEDKPLLKTPTANLGGNGGSQHPAKRKAGGHGPNLADEIEHLLPTPRASDGAKGSPKQKYGDGSLTLASTAAALAAPTTPTWAAARPRPVAPHHSVARTARGHSPTPAETTEPLLPTPTSSDGSGGAGTHPSRKGGVNLRTAVTRLPTGGATTCPPSADGSASPPAPHPCPRSPARTGCPPNSSSG
ncbi:hypothetical protein GCM10012280_65540 [Wenjunlia tyrosinilytica]|uniref:Uncharacterized protein n=1 Tax=Wenjunlia tyrosinilytica TaxID=1544741 RepID=A0A918E159_9ACTN|nr:hypothetical protein GCM10012280_65540 [Wenjunlia tyrosinilytica]